MDIETNCDTCGNMNCNHPDLYCYMFDSKPIGNFCTQHTKIPKNFKTGMIEILCILVDPNLFKK